MKCFSSGQIQLPSVDKMQQQKHDLEASWTSAQDGEIDLEISNLNSAAASVQDEKNEIVALPEGLHHMRNPGSPQQEQSGHARAVAAILITKFRLLMLPRHQIVIVVPAVVAIETILFLVLMFFNNCPARHQSSCILQGFLGRLSFEPPNLNPSLGAASQRALSRMGALNPSLVRHQVWRLATSTLLNAGLLQLIVTATGLLCLGLPLEAQYGSASIAALICASGMTATALSAIIIPGRITVTAGSPVLGLVGALSAEIAANWVLYERRLLKLGLLAGFASVCLLLGRLPFVNNVANLGGLIAGLLLGIAILHRPSGRMKRLKMPPGGILIVSKKRWSLLWVVATAVLVVSSVAMLVVLFVARSAQCGWCERLMACQSSSSWDCCDRIHEPIHS